MKALDEYIEKIIRQHKRGRKMLAESGRENPFEKHIEEECKEKGFYEIGQFPGNNSSKSIVISYHGLPDEFSKRGYMHRHNYFEIMYVYRGGCYNKTPEETLYLQEGDIMLLNPNVLHCPHVEHEEDVLLNFHIPNDLIQQNIIPMLRENPIFMSFFIDFFYRSPKSKRFLYFPNNPPEVRQMCDKMCLERFQQQDFYGSILESSLTILFALLARQYKHTYQISETSAKDCQIYDILTYIEQNCADVTLESLSKKFPYTPSYLSRFIKKHTGKSFSEIVQAQKMARVVQYLSSTSLPIIEIANLVGFSDIVYFNKVFKARFGQSPTEYRKQVQR